MSKDHGLRGCVAFASLALSISAVGCAVTTDGGDAISDQAIASEKWIARGDAVFAFENRVPRLVGKRYTANVALYALAADSLATKQYAGAVIVNPGAVIRSTDVKTLAETLARKGYITYVANNPVGDVKEDQGGPATGPIPLLAAGLVPKLASALSTNPRSVKDLPASIASAHEAWSSQGSRRLFAIGHSLGAAVLGTAANQTDTGLAKMVLIGADQIVDARFPFGITPPPAGRTAVDLVFVRGEKDGLASAEQTRTLAAKYPNAKVLPDVLGANHFCIIDGAPGDPKLATVGAPGKRAEDAPATLPTVQACVDATVETILKEF